MTNRRQIESIKNCHGEKMRLNKKSIILVSSILALILLGTISAPHLLKTFNYNKAMNNMNTGKFDEALEWFQKNESEYTSEIYECNYLKATNLLAQNEFEDAYTLFEQLGDYKDSSEMMVECNYSKAISLFEQKSFEDAGTLFEQLGHYKNSSEMLVECKYQQAQNEYKENSYQKAAEMFYELGSYKDSQEQYGNCVYEIGKKYYDEGDYVNAIVLLEKAKNRENDAAKKLYMNILNNEGDYLYRTAEVEYQNGDFETARTAYTYAVKSKAEEPEQMSCTRENCEFMLNIQGEYISPVNEGTVSIHGFTFIDENGTEHILMPYEQQYGTYSWIDMAIIDGDENYYIKYVEDGEIYQINRNNKDDNLSVWETEENQLADIEREQQRKQEELANAKKEPAVGMTEEEVLNSTWGEPKQKNKTTYEWGTSEQWVYSNNRYIYFDNGIVTAISESE